tara:strand:- start:191 stop:1120 length:930 start_codon:yes stop_codon:yes gene_type:complete
MFNLRAFSMGLISLVLINCSSAPEGEVFWAAAGAGQTRILVANVQNGNEAISIYDANGNVSGILDDFSLENLDPEGMVALNPTEFLISLDGIDQIRRVNIFGETLSTISNTNLNGNIYQIAANNDTVFVIESNRIECFEKDSGNRIANPCIDTNVGACTLSTPRSLTINADGNLVVINNGNDRILVYDVSDPTATSCISSNTAANGLNPVGVLAHSNGNLYISTQGDDQVYELAGDGTGGITSIYNPGTSILNNPTALAEMPDGSILVASDGTNDILRIDSDGTPIAVPFIRTALTLNVSSILVVGGGN